MAPKPFFSAGLSPDLVQLFPIGIGNPCLVNENDKNDTLLRRQNNHNFYILYRRRCWPLVTCFCHTVLWFITCVTYSCRNRIPFLTERSEKVTIPKRHWFWNSCKRPQDKNTDAIQPYIVQHITAFSSLLSLLWGGAWLLADTRKHVIQQWWLRDVQLASWRAGWSNIWAKETQLSRFEFPFLRKLDCVSPQISTSGSS